jgi:non-homologous end joining protein Ku
MDLIEKKRKSGEDVVEAEGVEETPDDIIDLMEVLKRSLSGKVTASSRSPKHKSAAKKAAKKAPKKSTAKRASKTTHKKAS